MGVLSSYRKEYYHHNPLDDKMKQIKQLAKIRYGRRGTNKYYMTASIYDQDVIDVQGREFISVKGFSYSEIIEKMYKVLFN